MNAGVFGEGAGGPVTSASPRGPLLAGVKFAKEFIRTETLIYRSVTGTVRKIAAEHREMGKFELE